MHVFILVFSKIYFKETFDNLISLLIKPRKGFWVTFLIDVLCNVKFFNAMYSSQIYCLNQTCGINGGFPKFILVDKNMQITFIKVF